MLASRFLDPVVGEAVRLPGQTLYNSVERITLRCLAGDVAAAAPCE